VRVYQFRHIRVGVRGEDIVDAPGAVRLDARGTGETDGSVERRSTTCSGRFASLGRAACAPLSSRGLGRRPLMAETRVRIPVAVLVTPREYGAFVVPEAAERCSNSGPRVARPGIYRLRRRGAVRPQSNRRGRALSGEHANEHGCAGCYPGDAPRASGGVLDPVGGDSLDPVPVGDCCPSGSASAFSVVRPIAAQRPCEAERFARRLRDDKQE
jgi:hypothetical protein